MNLEINARENRHLDREFGGQPSRHSLLQINRLQGISRIDINVRFRGNVYPCS